MIKAEVLDPTPVSFVIYFYPVMQESAQRADEASALESGEQLRRIRGTGNIIHCCWSPPSPPTHPTQRRNGCRLLKNAPVRSDDGFSVAAAEQQSSLISQNDNDCESEASIKMGGTALCWMAFEMSRTLADTSKLTFLALISGGRRTDGRTGERDGTEGQTSTCWNQTRGEGKNY